MLARTLLAALHWNSRKRKVATTTTVDAVHDAVFSKRRKTWVLRQWYKCKLPAHVHPLMKRVMEVHRKKIQLDPIIVPDGMPKHVPTVDKPTEAQLHQHQKTRFVVTEDYDLDSD